MWRVDALMVRVVMTEYDADGRPIGEQMSQEAKVFRPNLDAFLANVDAAATRVRPTVARLHAVPGGADGDREGR